MRATIRPIFVLCNCMFEAGNSWFGGSQGGILMCALYWLSVSYSPQAALPCVLSVINLTHRHQQSSHHILLA